MNDENNPVDRVVELFVFAPLGLALSARELLPQLVERGRQQVNGQMAMAKMIGQFAVQQGQTEAEKALVRARARAEEALEQFGLADQPTPVPTPTRAEPPEAPPPTAPPTPSPARPDAPAPPPPPSSPSSPTPPGVATTIGTPEELPTTADLAIPDYDSLSASQVVPRLSGLSAVELEAVRLYESTHRSRKTITTKVAQLQGP